MKKRYRVLTVMLLTMGILFTQMQPVSAKPVDWKIRHIKGAPTSEQIHTRDI